MMIRGGLVFSVIVYLASQILMVHPLLGQQRCESCVDSALQFLRFTNDKYHHTFDVYTDQDAAGNHFAPTGWMPAPFPEDQLDYYGDWLQIPHSGNTCIRITTSFQTGGGSWAGICWQYPDNNWGTVPNAGYDLTGADSLIFYAKGEIGGEQVEFYIFGTTGPYGDSEPRWPSAGSITLLNSTWTRYSIDLSGKNLSYVIGGFAFVVVKDDNGGNDITFYLDDIQYIFNDNTQKARFEEPHFLLSYEASFDSADYDEDFSIRNAAFSEYSALAMLALTTDTSNLNSEDWKRAKHIGDAFVIAQDSDRYFNVANGLYDGRLRNGYMAGDLLDRLTGYTKIPGWWDPDSAKFFEVEFAAGTFVGPMAWIIMAWLQYNRWQSEHSYVDAAVDLGNWIRGRYDNDGYRTGFQGFDSTQTELSSKSVEHNILVYSAFIMLGEATGNIIWFDWAEDAKDWVEGQWDNQNDLFPEPSTNIHALAFLYLGDSFASGLEWIESNTLVDPCPVGDPFSGFDFNNDIDGIWFEGTAQMALAFLKNGDISKAQMYLEEIEDAQMNARNADERGIVEACHDSVTTGFFGPGGNKLFKINRLHTGSTSWYILANSGNISAVSVPDKNSALPSYYRLECNYPNPFNPETTIKYDLPRMSKVTLVVYNLLGEKIRTIVDEHQSAGSYAVIWDGTDEFQKFVSSGLYFYRINADDYIETRKMLLLR
jgi:hypothetical protein